MIFLRIMTIALLAALCLTPAYAENKQGQGYFSGKGDALDRLNGLRGDQAGDNLKFHRPDNQIKIYQTPGVTQQQRFSGQQSRFPQNRYGPKGQQPCDMKADPHKKNEQSTSLAPSPLTTRPIPEMGTPPPNQQQKWRIPDGKSVMSNPGAPAETLTDRISVLKGIQAQKTAEWAKKNNIKMP